jgi:hypothetical protein
MGLRAPIVNAPMGGVAGGELAAAVSTAVDVRRRPSTQNDSYSRQRPWLRLASGPTAVVVVSVDVTGERVMNDLGPFEWMRDVMGDEEADDVYAELSSGGSPAGRAAAARVSYRAREFWPDFFSVANRPALAACAQLFDEYRWLTPELAERAVDDLLSRAAITPQDVVEAAQLIDDRP